MEATPVAAPASTAAPVSGDAGPMLQPGLDAELRERATGFEFFQAVRVLERLLPHRTPVGGFGEPQDEIVRFSVHPDIAFPASEIYALDRPPGGGQARLAVTFMGLTGPQGVLPYAYSELVAERVRARDTALRAFLDLFHHRLISLFYRAWEKYRFQVSHERDRRDLLTQHLKDLIGLGVEGLQDRLGAVVGDEVWDPHARVRLRLGPLTRRQYDQFLPGGNAYQSLRTLTRFFSGDQLDFEVQLVLARDEVPGCVLGEQARGTPLGWCTWMRSRPFGRDPDDTVLTL